MKPVIRVEHLSKLYHIGSGRGGYRTLRESIMETLSAPWRRLRECCRLASGRGNGASCADTIWALQDVSFEVQAGEVVALVGRNGAGKSTLLKIMSRITEPTAGRVELRGRVGSLLEVGTGFHPELTGRENIFLNGAILGMSRHETRRKFDEIVAFAEIDQFLDTPVKRYSSGMSMRLAFAVAAHLEPEILLVDEVIAVGDASFQAKCLGKMSQIGSQGRTVICVSHNMAALSSLCRSGVWLSKGHVVRTGPAQEIIRDYLLADFGDDMGGVRDLSTVARTMGGDLKVRFLAIELRNSEGQLSGCFQTGEPIDITLHMESTLAVPGEVNYSIKTIEGINLFTSSSNDSGKALDLVPGKFRLQTRIDPNYLRPGKYLVQLNSTCLSWGRDVIAEAIAFEILEDRHYSKGKLYRLPGHLYFPYEWHGPEPQS